MRRAAAAVAATAGLAVACSSCGLALQQLPVPGGPAGPTYAVHATFANVLNLPLGAKVRDGVAVVGDVSAITAHDFAAHTTLTIGGGVRLPVGTTAQVRFESPLGDDFVQLQPPPGRVAGPFLGNGASIPEADTSTAPSIEDTLTALAAVLNGSGLQQVQVIIAQLNDALAGNTGNVRALLDDLDQLTGSLAAHTGDIDAALGAMGSLSQELAQGSGTIAQGIAALTPAVATVQADDGALDDLVSAVNQLTATATQVVDQSGQATVDDVQDLVPVVTQLVGVDSQLGGDLATLSRFEKVFPSVTPSDYLQLSLDASVNLPAPAATPPIPAERTVGTSATTGADGTPVVFLAPGRAGDADAAAGAVVLAEAALP